MSKNAVAALVVLLAGAALLASCANPEAAADDPDLYIGDRGVEAFLHRQEDTGPIAANEAKKKVPIFDPSGFPLIERFPNPSVRPIRGKYAENVVKTAKSYLGVPYVYGSDRTEPTTFDCSDFTRWVYLESIGMDLPWDSRSQAAYVKAFSKKIYTSLSEARRGDLLFFTNYRGENASDYEGLRPSEKPITHTAIYLGNGKVIHSASKLSGGVRIDEWSWRQLHRRFLFGGGIVPAAKSKKIE